jgi:hypothetical protein
MQWALIYNSRRTRYEDWGVTLHASKEDAMKKLLSNELVRQNLKLKSEESIRNDIFEEEIAIDINGDDYYMIVPVYPKKST